MSMIFLNEITITGRLTKKPELRYYKNSKGVDSQVTTARVCFNDKRNNSKVNFINVEIFGQKAVKVCEQYDKGNLVYIKGNLRKTKYTNKDGQIRYKVDIFCESIRRAEGIYLNNIEVSGYITRKPEFKSINTKYGNTLNLSTTSIAFKDKRNYDKSYFIDIVVFDKDAEKFYENIDKGNSVYLKGSLKNRSYTNSSGERRHYLEFVVEEYQKIFINKIKYNNEQNELNETDEDKINAESELKDNNVNDIESTDLNENIFGFSLIDDEEIPF